MASTIAAITTGVGGVVTTADATGNLSLLSGATTIVAVTSTGTSVTGTLAVSGVTTLTGGLNAALPVLSGGTGVTTSTGSGNNVLGTSPTLTTPTISSLSSASATALTLQSAGTTAITVDTSQNVGIGTTSPSKKLEVYATANSLQIESVVRNDQAGSGVAAIGFNVSSNAAAETTSTKAGIGLVRTNAYGVGSLCFYNNSTGSAGDFTTADERMRIDSSGNVSIGTTSTSGKFTVVAGNGVGSDISNTNTNDMIALWGNKGNSSSSAMYIIPIRSGDSTLRGSIYWTGSTIQYNTSSDYRLKENIAPMTGALAKVLQLKPVTYTWKESGFDGQGFIAHELQEIIPDCITGEKDAVNEDGSIKPQGIDTSFLVATLTAAIQEQQTIINDLKARITALEAK